MTTENSNALMRPKTPTLPPPEAVVKQDEQAVAVSDDEALDILKERGLIKVSARGLHNLAKLGIKAKGIGVMNIQIGSAVVSQEWLLAAQQVLGQKIQKKQLSIKSAVALARSLGFVGGKLTELMSFIAHTQGIKREGSSSDDSKPKTPSFAPGVNIQINNPPGIQPAEVIVSEEKPVDESPMDV